MTTKGRWKCTECGETAISKCVSQRNVFPDDQAAVMLNNTISYGLTQESPWNEGAISGQELAEFTFYIKLHRILTKEEAKHPKEILTAVINTFRNLDEETLKHALCRHRWVITEGQCDFGCHKAEEEEVSHA